MGRNISITPGFDKDINHKYFDLSSMLGFVLEKLIFILINYLAPKT